MYLAHNAGLWKKPITQEGVKRLQAAHVKEIGYLRLRQEGISLTVELIVQPVIGPTDHSTPRIGESAVAHHELANPPEVGFDAGLCEMVGLDCLVTLFDCANIALFGEDVHKLLAAHISFA